MKYNLKKRIMAFLLAVVMLVGVVPGTGMTAYAAKNIELNTKMNTLKGVSKITVKNIDGKLVYDANPWKIELENKVNKIDLEFTYYQAQQNFPNPTVTLNGKAVSGDKASILWENGNECVATIVISFQGIPTTYTYNITFSLKEIIKVTEITLPETSEINVNEIIDLEAIIKPENATSSLVWSTSDSSIATVDSNGKVTGKQAGTVTITASADGVEASCEVTVKNIDVSEILLNKTETEIAVGYTETLTATVAPENATNQELEWSSSDTSVATVDQNGTVTGISAGTAKITAKAKDGSDIIAECNFTVKLFNVTNVELDKEELHVNIGYTEQLIAAVLPEKAANKNVIWSSSEPSVATVDSNGKVKGISVGEAIITATSADKNNGEIFDSCKVIVHNVAVTGISLDKTQLNLYVRDTEQLTATVSPNEATDKSIIWSSDNKAVATVDANGVVTAVSEGKTFIKAESNNFTATCNVDVKVLLEKNIDTSCVSARGSSNDKYDTWLKTIKIKAVDVVDYKWNEESGHKETDKHVLYVRLSKETPNDAEIKLSSTLGHKNNSFKGGYDATPPDTVTLNNGYALATIKTKPYHNWYGVNRTYEIHFTNKENNTPEIVTGTITEVEKAIGETFELDLSTMFDDVDSIDKLSYTVTENGETSITGSDFSKVISEVAECGYIEYIFTATDMWGASASHTIRVNTIEARTYNVSVEVPQDISPAFYIIKEFSDGVDVLGKELSSEKGETNEGFTQYTVKVPETLDRISVRDENWGGMTFNTKSSEGNIISDSHKFIKVQHEFYDIGEKTVDGTLDVSYGEYKATKGVKGYLLLSSIEYKYNATPSNKNIYIVGTKTEKLEYESDSYIVKIEVPLNAPVTITAPTGAKAQLYDFVQYYKNPEYSCYGIKDNGDGTSTSYFIGTSMSPGGSDGLLYRVTYKDYIVKAGWISGSDYTNRKPVVVTFGDNDLKKDARIDYSTSNDTNKSVAEDGVLLNINGRNNLVMSVGDSKTLKAYRVWEIIPYMTQNWIITPDFNYNIISGNEIIKLESKKSVSTTETDWKTITAIKNGTAVIEVSYDAVSTTGIVSNGWGGVYGATNPARTGLFVVQVGGHVDVDFGIQGFSSQYLVNDQTDKILYKESDKKSWDAEFDTLYFTGDKGELKLSPKANEGSIQKVQISADKGKSYITLIEQNGVYTAPIEHGNNIIRVITDHGEAYQVVRGYKINVTYKITNDNGNGIVDLGETVRVIYDGLHNPIPKMSGNYNPGYNANTDGYSSTHLNYTFNEQAIAGPGSQYSFITSSNYIDVTIPANTTQTSFTLSNGYIGSGVLGLPSFANEGADSHRNIPDDGCGTRGGMGKSTFNTRCILPDITINIGDQSAPNSAPYTNNNAVTEAKIEIGQKYAINPEILFIDDDKDTLTFTYSVNGEEKGTTDKTFIFTPDSVGEYVIGFTANDGKLTAQHSFKLTVANATQKDTTLKFNIDPQNIKGYVTVGFEDRVVREEDSYGLRYPVALGTIISATRVPFEEGDTIAEVTIRLLDAMGIGYDYSGNVTSSFYLSAIKNFVVDNIPYGSMGEFDAGEGSGWMITSNDWFIDKGASEFLVKDGDIIQWKYTCQLGSDIGDNSWENTTKEVEDLIFAIGTPVTVNSIDKINAARAAYDVLSAFYQSKVKNYNDLLAAEKALETLIENTAKPEDGEAAAYVDKLIEEIGTVTFESTEKINIARTAYVNLSPLQKKLVKKLKDLETAENVLKQLSSESHETVYKNTGIYLVNLGIPAVGTTGGEWMVIGLARGNKGLSGTLTDGYYNGVSQYIDTVFSGNKSLKDSVRLHENKSTDNARVILGLTAAGIDATNVNGYNLFDGLNNMDYINRQGVNGPMWTLIALNSHPSYKLSNGDVTEDKLIQVVLKLQLTDGGWDLSNTSADVDMTAMAIQALAPYYNSKPAVKEAIDKALSKLSSMQQKDGSFASVDGVNAESTAQVIVALTSLGINPEKDSRFIKKGMSPVDALCNFAVNGGGFMHTPNTSRDGMATEQGYYALVSYFRLLNSETSLYDMRDITALKVGKINPNAPSAYDEAAANEVEKVINALGKITLYSNLKLEAARKAYDKLTALQKKLVENYETLVNAEKKYEKLVDEAVEKVEDLIYCIGEVTLESGEDITAARRAYNQLPPHVQKLIKNLKMLEKAEKEYKKLREEALELIRNGKTVLTKSELLELQDKFADVTEKTKYNDALSLLITYFKLGEKQQLALAGSEQLETLKAIVAKQNHENPTTGITMYGLEWNIKVKTDKLPEKDEHIKDDIISKLGDAQMLTIWDIHLEDVLTGKGHTLDDVVEVCIPVDLIGDYTFYDRLGVVHYADDGSIEVLNCKIVDGYVVFNAVDFSYYAIVGFMDAENESEMTTGTVVVETPEYEELIEKAEEVQNADNNWLVWAGTAGVGIVLLAVLLILKRRTTEEIK